MHSKEFKFKCALLNNFWNGRNQDMIRSNSPEFGLKNQKYLLFYNLFARYNKTYYTLDSLMAFENGPVFYDIYSYSNSVNSPKYTNQLYSFNQIDEKLDVSANKAAMFVLHFMNAEQISNLTHKFDFWSKHENRFSYGFEQISEEDISENDEYLIKWLYKFTMDLLEGDYHYFQINGNYILFDSISKEKLTPEIFSTLESMNFDYSPVIIEIDEEGVLSID